MAFAIISNNQIVGFTSDENMGLPSGFSLVETPDGYSVDQLYYDGSEVQIKPMKPSEASYWQESTNSWIEPQENTSPQFMLASNPLAVAVYDHLKSLDVVLADAIGLILAQVTSDDNEYQIRLEELQKHFTNP